MNFLIFFAILIVGAHATDNEVCSAEIIRIRNEIVAHVNDNTFDYMNVYHKLKKLHQEEITEEEFGTFLDGFCPKALDGTQFGLAQIPTISEGCATYPAMQIKINLLKFFSVVFGKFCSENGKGYKDVVKNKGTNCFFDNQEYKECFKTHNMQYFADENFKDSNICNYIKVQFDCENILDKCDNLDAKTLHHGVTRELKELMKCTFD